MVGVCITLYPNFYAICGGRILYGISVGLLAVCTARLMEETLPLNVISGMGALYCVSFPFATFLADLMASILPPDTDTAALKETNNTMYIFGLPLVFYVI
jgi:hypothetical protein